MARTQVHRPSAAAEAAFATSGVKSSKSMYGIMSSMVSSLMASLLYVCRLVRKRESAMTFCALPYDGFINSTCFFLTVSSASPTGSMGSMNRISTPSNTSRMISLGFGSFLTSLICAGLIDAMAVLAWSRNGCALARSASQADFSPAMRAASSSHSILILFTFSLSRSASDDEISRLSSISFVSLVALSSLICSSASTTFMASTSLAPCTSFCRPRLMRSSLMFTSASLSVYVVR
mmetsp:Transcript_53887/g.129838  ORF Transcript_53887/g.129838 Transcript_53887/m.129838 type:complete len:235 (-) Transcript_53887:3368-4072(-)